MKINIGIKIELQRLLETRLLVTAGSGAGKSWLLRKIAEESIGKVQVILLDIEGEFATLREKYDYALVATENGDIPLNLRYAETLAHKLLESGMSTIIDLYELKHSERITFVKRFLDAMINAPKHLWHSCLIIVDEAHQFCSEKGKEESKSAVIDLMTRGRKRGFCGVLASQRLSKLNKDAAAEAFNKLIGRTGLDIDRDRSGAELGMNKKEDILSLRNLPDGDFYSFGPAISNEIKLFHVAQVKTHHPQSGQKIITNPPTPAKIKSIISKLKDLPQEAEKELKTKQDLQNKVRELEGNLRTAKKQGVSQDKIEEIKIKTVEAANKEVEKKISSAKIEIDKQYKLEIVRIDKEYKQGYLEYQKYITLLQKTYESVIMKYQAVFSKFGKLLDELKEAGVEINLPPPDKIKMPVLDIKLPSFKIEVTADSQRIPAKTLSSVKINKQISASKIITVDNGEFKLTPKQQDILNALAWYESLNNPAPTLAQIGAVALINPSGGHFSNTVGPLSSHGLIVRNHGTISLTDAGRELAEPIESVNSLNDYHNVLRERIRRMKSAGGKTIEMLNVIINAQGGQITTEQLGQEVGIDHTGGHFNNMIGPLSTAGLIRRQGGIVTPTEILFPEGLI